jgi:aspartate aminotransferase
MLSGRTFVQAPRYSRAFASRLFDTVPLGPPDPIFGLQERFTADTADWKVTLTVGAYRDNQGKPTVLPSIREAEKRIYEKAMNNEYAAIHGLPEFLKHARGMQFGIDHPRTNNGTVAHIQTLSGTGALRVSGDFLKKMGGADAPTIYLPDPTWGNHHAIYQHSKLNVQKYRYFDRNTNALDFAGIIEDINNAADGSAFLFHNCAHNPTGQDPTKEQWLEIFDATKAKTTSL